MCPVQSTRLSECDRLFTEYPVHKLRSVVHSCVFSLELRGGASREVYGQTSVVRALLILGSKQTSKKAGGRAGGRTGGRRIYNRLWGESGRPYLEVAHVLHHGDARHLQLGEHAHPLLHVDERQLLRRGHRRAESSSNFVLRLICSRVKKKQTQLLTGVCHA